MWWGLNKAVNLLQAWQGKRGPLPSVCAAASPATNVDQRFLFELAAFLHAELVEPGLPSFQAPLFAGGSCPVHAVVWVPQQRQHGLCTGCSVGCRSAQLPRICGPVRFTGAEREGGHLAECSGGQSVSWCWLCQRCGPGPSATAARIPGDPLATWPRSRVRLLDRDRAHRSGYDYEAEAFLPAASDGGGAHTDGSIPRV